MQEHLVSGSHCHAGASLQCAPANPTCGVAHPLEFYFLVRQSICKQEAAHRPCPRIILVCCTHLVTTGLSAEGLFQKDAPDDLVHFLLGAFEEGVASKCHFRWECLYFP